MQNPATNILGPLIESVGTLTLVLLTYHRFTVEAEGAVHVLRGEERGNFINLRSLEDIFTLPFRSPRRAALVCGIDLAGR